MGYYDKGSYNSGSYNPDQERQTARDRYLDLLNKQQMNTQAMADKENRAEAKLAHNQEEDAAGADAVKGAQLGMTAGGPWGALVGGLIGKGMGSYEYGQKHGAGKGIVKFLDPRGEFHAMTGTNGQSGNAGAGLANMAGSAVQQKKNDRLRTQIEAQKSQGGEYDALEKSSYDSADQQDMGQKFEQASAEPLTSEEEQRYQDWLNKK